MEQQVALINFNKHFANGKASDFEQNFNKELNVPPNTSVGLYSGKLQRKPVVLPTEENVEIDLVSQYPTKDQRSGVGDFAQCGNFTNKPAPGNISFTMPKGGYTKAEFVKVFRQQCSEALADKNTNMLASDTFLNLKAIGDNDVDGVFVGLAKEQEVVSMDINETSNTTAGERNWMSIDLPVGRDGVFKPQTKNVDNWNQFVRSKFPLNCQSRVHNALAERQVDEQSAFFWRPLFSTGDQSDGSVIQRQYVGFLNTSLTSNLWADSGTVKTSNLFPVYNTAGDGVPLSVMGIHTRSNYNWNTSNTWSTMTHICVNKDILDGIYSTTANIRPYRDGSWEEIDGDMYSVYRFNYDDPNNASEWGIRFYQTSENYNAGSVKDHSPNNKYFFQLIAKDFSGGALGYYSGGVDTLYDSRAHNISLPASVVEGGFLTDNIKSTRNPADFVSGGLIPYIFFRNCAKDTMCFNPRGVFTGIEIGGSDLLQVGLNKYRYLLTNSRQLKNILGVANTTTLRGTMGNDDLVLDTSDSYLASSYPNVKNADGGVVQLYADDIRYNIEIPSLPIRTFNTTALSKNVAGAERPVLYTAECFVDGEITRLENTKLTKNILPNEIKYISLKNRQHIKLNSLEVQVRRADDNEVADEIEDVSVEMLLQN